MKFRKSCGYLIFIVSAALSQPAYSINDIMQIEQVIGGVNGDVTAQAVQLRMRALSQNFISGTRIRVRDASGANPVTLITFGSNVTGGTCTSNPTNSRILIASTNFNNFTSPAVAPDFTFTNLIPELYLAAGSLTYESPVGAVLWRISWGGVAYTGITTGNITNDSNGDFGPPFPGPLPSTTLQALQFQATPCAQSTTNEADYGLTTSAAVFTNNNGQSFTVTGPTPTGACCDDSTGTCTEGFTQEECESLGRRYGGDGSTCETIDPACEPPVDPPIPIGLELVAEGLTAPVYLTHAGDGSGRLFILDQAGQIRIVKDGALLPTPYLDLTDRMVTVNPNFDERGLLGLAFHPDYATNGRFFVRYSKPRTGVMGERCFGTSRGCHEAILAEFSVLGDPATSDVADPNSEIILFRVDEPEFNHDGGQVAFGPDGLLYWTLGDGGGGNDDLHLNGLCDAGTCTDNSVCSVSAQDCVDTSTCVSDLGVCSVPATPCTDDSACLPSGTTPHGPIGNGQNTQTALGNILRIDVDSGLPYAVPPGNPFADGVNGVPEIYAYGFRNPYRFSFDNGPGGSGSLFVGDVGQALFEEIDLVPVLPEPPLLNFGWVIREGFHCFDPFNPDFFLVDCPEIGPFGETMIDPVLEYNHSLGLAVIGGYVYRGSAYPPLQGKYVFGDFSQDFGPTGQLFYTDIEGPEAFVLKEFFIAPEGDPFGKVLFGIGEDEAGELYALASANLGPVGIEGVVFKIVPPVPITEPAGARYVAATVPPSTTPMAIAFNRKCAGATIQYVGTPSGPQNVALQVATPANAAFLTSLEWGLVVNITGIDITAATDYNVQIDYGTVGVPALSSAVTVRTYNYGDSTRLGGGLPNGGCDIVDILAAVDGWLGDFRVPLLRLDMKSLSTCLPDQTADIVDILQGVDCWLGVPDPCAGVCP